MGFAAAVMLMDLVAAVDHTVGAPSGGWDQSTDLQTWATSQTFSVGDNIGNEFLCLVGFSIKSSMDKAVCVDQFVRMN